MGALALVCAILFVGMVVREPRFTERAEVNIWYGIVEAFSGAVAFGIIAARGY